MVMSSNLMQVIAWIMVEAYQGLLLVELEHSHACHAGQFSRMEILVKMGGVGEM
jgi:hypothetical protein